MMNTRTGRISSAAAAMIAAAVLVAGATGPAYAAADPTTEAPAKVAPQPGTEKLYCLVDTPTGSHMRKKVCRTRADWIARGSGDPAAAARK